MSKIDEITKRKLDYGHLPGVGNLAERGNSKMRK